MAEDDSPMDRRTFLKATGAAGAGVALANVAQADEGTHQSAGGESGVLLATYTDNADPAAVRENFPSGVTVREHHRELRFFSLEVEQDSPYGTMSAEARVAEDPNVVSIDRNEFLRPHAVEPEDRLFEQQYAPQQVRADRAWEETFGGDEVTIGIVDTGVDYEHPDLADRFPEDPGKDFVDDDDDPMPPGDGENHGTHVAGIASATTDNGTGVSGMSDSTLISCRALGPQGGSIEDIAEAIRYATDRGADIINMSLGGGGRTEVGKNAVSYALDNGALPFASAGNACAPQVGFPARYDEVVAVSAVDEDQNLASFSNKGPNVEITGPGVNVLSTWATTPQNDPYGGKYNAISGTSMSCPAVAGVAALGLAADPELSPTELRGRLKETAVDIGLSDEEQGAGRADAVRLVGGVGEDQPDAGPTARVSADPGDPHVGENVYVTAAESTDPDGYVDAWEWEFGDGATATGQNAVHSYDEPGDYRIGLTVTDEDGQTATASTTVSVQSGTCGTDERTEEFSGTVESDEGRDTSTYSFATDEPCLVEITYEGNDEFILYASQRSSDFLQTECQGEVVLRPRDIRTLDTSGDLTVGIFSGNGQDSPTGDWTATVTETGFTDGGTDPNEPPEAAFTPESPTVQPGKAIEFDASGSSDPDGTVESYEWEFGDGATGSGQTATHAYGSAGTYEVTLTVTDDAGATGTATTTVTVEAENEAPDAAFSVSAEEVETGTEVTFDAAPAEDPDGRIRTYRWAFDDGTSATGETVTHAYDSVGTYAPTLTVEDGTGATDSAQETIEVTGDGDDGGCGSSRETTETGRLAGSQDATAYTYATQFADPCALRVDLTGPSGSDFDLYFTFDGRVPTPTDYDRRSYQVGSEETIVLEGDYVEAGDEYGILVDSYSGGGAYDLTITERGSGSGDQPPANEPPEATFAATDDAVRVGQEVSFDAAASTDPDGTVESYDWDLGDGSTATGPLVTQGYDSPGTYTVTLTVTDDDGATDTAEATVEVSASDPVCGSVTETASTTGRLASSFDESVYAYVTQTADPCQVTLALSGPAGTDFDLYVTTDGRTPTTVDFDKRSVGPDSNETIVVEDVSSTTELGILVDAWAGAGQYEVAVEELGR